MVYHGDADGRIDPSGSERLASESVFGKRAVARGDRVLRIVPGCRHCLHLEPCAEDIVRELVAFAKERCAADTETDVVNPPQSAWTAWRGVVCTS